MTDLADANLVIAAIQEEDAQHARARRHLARQGRLTVPLSVGIEILLGARSRRSSCAAAMTRMAEDFDVEELDLLLTAARALDGGAVREGFDALHLAAAALRGAKLHTADAALQRTAFPTVAF